MSLTTTLVPGPVNWKAIPEIKADLDHHEKMRNGDVRQTKDIANSFLDDGHVYLLKVKVYDPLLAQAVLLRGFSPQDGSLIPGFEIQEISINPEGSEKQKLASHLRKMADELELYLNPNVG
jgi:hypothetical protein